jgi:hypothetical protein
MMRKETPEMLAVLLTKYPTPTLLGLWSDLRKLKKAEFESLLNSFSTKRPPTPKKRRGVTEGNERTLPDDTPTSRIEHLLLTKAGMDPSRAVDEITSQLLRQKIAGSRIPAFHGRQFSDWLSTLFRTVPASQVMHAALQIGDRVAR